MNRRAAGYIAEELAARRLEKDGYRILARNEKCAGVEVDIIAAEGGDLVFAEVKASSSEFASPAEHITREQRRCYVRAAKAYVQAHSLFGVNVRFDAVEVRDGAVTVIRGAFDAEG